MLEFDRFAAHETKQNLSAMLSSLAHRGPDGEASVQSGPIRLGISRLAVYDIAGGNQPFWSEDGSVAVIVNGTIYNHEQLRATLGRTHTFATKSDCEPIVHLYEEYGLGFTEHLVGMYAVAIWDARSETLILARDPLGIKPLFYAQTPGRLLFASEIKALLQHPSCPRSVDWQSVLSDPLFALRFQRADTPLHAVFEGVGQLSGGEMLIVEAEKQTVRTRRFWELPTCGLDGDGDPHELADAYQRLLHDSIDSCLTGEAEIGLALSGGIDSGLIAARSAAQGRSVPTFTCLTQPTLANGDCEGAVQLAHSLGLPSFQVGAADTGPISLDAWRDLLWLCETPLCGPEQIYKQDLFRYAKNRIAGLKVMMSGQGADEFTGGYSTSFAGLDGDWVAFLGRLREHRKLEHVQLDPLSAHWRGHLPSRLFQADYGVPGSQATDDDYSAFLREKRRDLLMYNLWSEDRLASASSIEARAPYLDHRLVELLTKIPTKLHQALLWDKEILRRVAVAGRLGDLARRPKVPFFRGIGEVHATRQMAALLAAEDCRLVRDALEGSQLGEIIDSDLALAVTKQLHTRPTPTSVDLLLRLVNAGLLESMAISRRVAPGNTTGIPAAFETGAESVLADSLVRIATRRAFSDAAYVRLAEDVLLLSSPVGEHFVAVAGNISFSVPADDPWWDVLTAIDGSVALGTVCESVGTAYREVESSALMAFESAILVPCERPELGDETGPGQSVESCA